MVAKKISGRARKIKQLTNYVGDVGVYELIKGSRKPFKVEFMLIAKTNSLSGPSVVAMWPCTDTGEATASAPKHIFQAMSFKESLDAIGYDLIA